MAYRQAQAPYVRRREGIEKLVRMLVERIALKMNEWGFGVSMSWGAMGWMAIHSTWLVCLIYARDPLYVLSFQSLRFLKREAKGRQRSRLPVTCSMLSSSVFDVRLAPQNSPYVYPYSSDPTTSLDAWKGRRRMTKKE